MQVFEFVLAIVFIALAAGVINNIIRVKAKRRVSDDSTADAAHYLAQLEALEDRVQVLERIVTDRNYDLKQKFRDLES